MEQRPGQSKREHIAYTIARTFNDLERLPMYANICKKHGLTTVLRAFAEAKSTPQSSIKKSHIALFRYLVKKYADQRKQNTNH